MNRTDKTEPLVAATMNDPRWAAVVARDSDADGKFFYSVKTTGVYCRPSCAARVARPENVAFHLTTADAERAGFRPCKRCKPDQASLTDQRVAKIADDLSELLQGVDALLLFQAPADVDYFVEICNRTFTTAEMNRLHVAMLSAYRWQYIASGAQHPHFAQVLAKLVSTNQAFRINAELAPILQEYANRPEHTGSDHPLNPGVRARSISAAPAP
jgi:methylphosphotriester-DNA--protein-cysteine methyltransferase